MVEVAKKARLQQRHWAVGHRIEIDGDGYTRKLEDNLFERISDEARSEFEAGAGSEIVAGSERSRMCALHSSSALVVNVFHYWRFRDVATIARLCGLESAASRMGFEVKHSTGLGQFPAHLDVEFEGSSSKHLAVESKFLETYSNHSVAFQVVRLSQFLDVLFAA